MHLKFRCVHAFLFALAIQMLSACGGGGSGGADTTSYQGGSSSSSSSGGGDGGKVSDLMTWGNAVPLSTGDRYASGLIGADGSAVVTWGQGDETSPYVKAKVSYYSNKDVVWSPPYSLDTRSIGVQKLDWTGGVQTLGTVSSSIIHNKDGGWEIWWRYCSMSLVLLCKNNSSLSFSRLDTAKMIWSSQAQIASEYNVKAEDSFRSFAGSDGKRWLSGSDWIAPLASDGIPEEKKDLSGVSALDSLGNMYVFSGKTNSINVYESSTKQWSNYALTTGIDSPINPHLIRYFEHSPGRLTFYWNDSAGTNSVRLWITEINPVSGARTARTVLIDTGVSSYYGEAAASDENGVTLLSVKTTPSVRVVTATRYDIVSGSVLSRQQLDVGALIDHASPLRLQRLGDHHVGAWEGKSLDGKVYIKAATLDRTGKLLGSVQEVGFVDSAKKDVASTINALWIDAKGIPNLVWNNYGEDINSWHSSVYLTQKSLWSPDSVIQSGAPLTQNGPFSTVLLTDENGEIAGVLYPGIGVAIFSLSPSGEVESGTQAYPNALKSSEYVSGKIHLDGTLSVLSRASDGRMWIIRSKR